MPFFFFPGKNRKSDQGQLKRLELNDLHAVIKKVCYSQRSDLFICKAFP